MLRQAKESQSASVGPGISKGNHIIFEYNSSMHLCIHQSFLSCQLVDEPKLQYQILIDDHHVDRQPNDVALNRRSRFRQRTYHQSAATEDHHEAYLQGETLPEKPYAYLDFFLATS